MTALEGTSASFKANARKPGGERITRSRSGTVKTRLPCAGQADLCLPRAGMAVENPLPGGRHPTGSASESFRFRLKQFCGIHSFNVVITL